MLFIDKLLDMFKLESTREAERKRQNTTYTATPPIYQDRFDSDYRKPDTYREIRFSGNKFDIPEVQLCAAILLSGNRNGSKIRNNNEYSHYFEGRYGIVNISTLHKWLYEQGYFRKASLPEALGTYKVPELKTILESMGQKKNGNKDALIDRIIANMDNEDKERVLNQCDRLFLSEKGLAFVWENDDYVMYHRKSYGLTFDEFNKHRILCGRKRRFHDTVFQALQEKLHTCQFKHYFSQMEMIYFWLSEVLYDEGRYDLALHNTLYRMYFSTNLSWHTYYFNIDHVRSDGIKKIKEYIKACNDVFHDTDLKRVLELRDYYNEHMLDIIYSLQPLPYTIFDRSDLARAINDLLNEVYFDKEYYTNYVCMKYEKYIRKFL